MADRLKIYACSGIGENAETQERIWDYWTDNTDCISNTQAVNTLIALINRNYIEVTRLATMTREDKIANLNDIDLYVVCLRAAQHCNQHYTQLQHAGAVIGDMLLHGAFDCQSLDAAERDNNLDQLLDKFDELYTDDTEPTPNPEFTTWFEENVVERNKVGLSKDAQATIKKSLKTAKKGISGDWKDNEDLGKYLSDAGTYFLYTYFTEDQLKKLPRVFTNKKRLQTKTYNYCKSLFVDIYGSETEMQEIIRAGIINQFKDTPENICAGTAEAGMEAKPVGVLLFGIEMAVAQAVSIIISIIVAVAGVIGTLITEVCKVVAEKNNAKYAAIDKAAVEASMPTEDDYEGLANKKPKTAGGGWLTYLLVGGAALGLILTSKKRK